MREIPGVLTEIRSATAKLHEDLERLPLLSGLMSPELTADQYHQYLEKNYQLFHFIEHKVFPNLHQVVDDLRLRAKLHLIERDLKTAGKPLPALIETGSEGSGYIGNDAFHIGMLYVTEGSTLGGQVILRHIKATLPDEAARSGAFLDAYGDRTGAMWKSFIGLLSAYDATADDAAKKMMVKGALYGFEMSKTIFSGQVTATKGK